MGLASILPSTQGSLPATQTTFRSHLSAPNPTLTFPSAHLQLSQNASLGPNVRPLPLQHEDRDVAPGRECEVAGWGVVSHAGRRPDLLQELRVPVMDRNTCNLRAYHDGLITESMLCAESRRRDTCRVRGPAWVTWTGWVEPEGRAGELGKGRGLGGREKCREEGGVRDLRELRWDFGWFVTRGPATQGDSGGPLVCDGVFEGVVSGGSRVCGNQRKPGVFIRVSSYLNWIKGVIEGNESAVER